MSCGKRGCKRTVRTLFYCRCGTSFCSETCFVSEWHADHRHSCPFAAEIKQTVADKRASSEKSGTAVLVAAALSKTTPTGGTGLLVASALSKTPPAQQEQPAPEPEAPPSVAVAVESSRPPAPSPIETCLTPAPRPNDQVAASLPIEAMSNRMDPLPRGISSTSSTPSDPTPPSKGISPLGTIDSTTSSSKSIQRYSKEDFVPVGGPIGNGSYGQVRKVVHKRTAELFAMKEIPKKKIKDHKMEDYLHLEIKLQYKLRHANILRLHYYFENAEMVYLLLEYAGGGSLFSHLRKKGKLPELEAAPVFVGVAKALHYMHNHSVVHRDLKPENILLCAGGVAKVADFGWSAEMKDGAPRHTFCGTWDYLSPEMVQNEPHDHTVDTWAVGVLLYEMITGRAPFAASSQMKALSRITNVDLQIPDYVSALARDLISKILVRARHQRLCLEDAVRHEWARRFVRVDDEVAPPGVNSSPVDRSPVADIDVSATPMVERPVPKPKASVGAAQSMQATASSDAVGGYVCRRAAGVGDMSVEGSPPCPLSARGRLVSSPSVHNGVALQTLQGRAVSPAGPGTPGRLRSTPHLPGSRIERLISAPTISASVRVAESPTAGSTLSLNRSTPMAQANAPLQSSAVLIRDGVGLGSAKLSPGLGSAKPPEAVDGVGRGSAKVPGSSLEAFQRCFSYTTVADKS